MKSSLSSLFSAPKPTVLRFRLPAWMIPAIILGGFVAVLLILFHDRLWPAREVKVAMVITTPAGEAGEGNESGNEEASAAFQASGWVEPDPLPVKATALVDGVIEEVLVLEGEKVTKGQPIARLIREDYELAERSAQEELRTRKAELVAHRQAIEAARRRVAARVADLEAAGVLVTETDDRLNRIQGLSRGTISESEVIAIESAHRRAEAVERSSSAALGQTKAEVGRLEAALTVIEHQIHGAEVQLDQARLALSRTVIRAPIDGLVLQLLSAPGQKKMLAMDDPESATVAILFDPAHLQVRVDVPLADAAGLQLGQKTRIRCSLLADQVFHGEVTRINGQADIQRNTLQVKVRIEDPDDRLRPDMLCRVEFLRAIAGVDSAAPSGLAFWVPSESLQSETLWVVDPESKRVHSRVVVPASQTKDGYTRISRGLYPGEWVVLSPQGLSGNQRVNPTMTRP